MSSLINIVNKLSGSTRRLIALFLILFTAQSYAQTGSLRGGTMALTNSNGTIMLAPPSGLLDSYTLTLPPVSSGFAQTRYLYDSSGFLKWGVPSGTGGGSGSLKINPGSTQLTTSNTQYLFNVSYAPGVSGPLPGVVIVSQTDNPNPDAVAMHVTAGNTNPSASGVAINGVIVNVSNAGSGTQYGICADARNGVNNYAMLFKAGNVGIGTTTPGEILEVNGNVLISGLYGLKINQWVDPGAGAATAGTMGYTTLVAGTKIVKTSSVTANSRIFLTTQTPVNVGNLYVSARTAGASFTISSTNAADASTVAWLIVEP